MPRSLGLDGIVDERVSREKHNVDDWLRWLWHTIGVVHTYRNSVGAMPMYTHSCNRYFRACSFIPLCASDEEERINIIDDELVDDEWHPGADNEMKYGD